MKQTEINEMLDKGWIQALVTFEIVGRPKEHIVASLDKYIENIKRDERIKVISQDREEALEHEDGMFSTFCEAEMLVKDLETFTWLCINFSPASIEILEPEELRVEARDITNWLNDLLSKVHDIGMDYRTQKASNEHLTAAMNALIQNGILISLRVSEKGQEQIAKDLGIASAQLDPFLKHLVEKKRIKQSDKGYSLA